MPKRKVDFIRKGKKITETFLFNFLAEELADTAKEKGRQQKTS
jgi:hypothetical protein